MTFINVNADYEAVLFSKSASSPKINQALEFLALFLDERPLLSSKVYSQKYLSYVEGLLSHSPVIKKSGVGSNWWGPLVDLEKEQWLNSKVTSVELEMKHHWSSAKVIRQSDDLISVTEQPLLMKDPFGMSGTGFKVFLNQNEAMDWYLKSPRGILIVEPLLKRRKDFAHYIYPDGKIICYENLVDEKFQYKGTILRDWRHPNVENLSFYALSSDREWKSFVTALTVIRDYYLPHLDPQGEFGFSVDSFVYEEGGEFKIRYLSEVNYRRTMGRVAFELATKFGKHRPWAMLVLGKRPKGKSGFEWMHSQLKSLLLSPDKDSGVMILSPGDERFEMFFLSAMNDEQGEELFQKMKKLLPDCQFTISF